MKRCERKITKEQYDEIVAVNPDGHISPELLEKYFSVQILCGYGLYGAWAVKSDDGYLIKYNIGDSCD